MSDATDPGRDGTDPSWPVALRGVTESVVTTRGPEGRWNVAALGLDATAGRHGSEDGRGGGEGDAGGGESDAGGGKGEAGGGESDAGEDEGNPIGARTWGDTRTRRNFRREGGGYVQFVRDPVLFVEAALSVTERQAPVLDAADAWVEVRVERTATGESGGTDWAEWALRPVAVGVEREVVPTIHRGFNAVVEATVAASRLDVPAYDREELVDRLAYFEGVVESCGGPAERRAFERLVELSDWR